MTLTQRIPIEIQFAQGLAGNEQKNRDKTFTLLKKFIRLRLPRLKEPLKEDEFIKLWKGMHYQLWMQDKPLIQEKLVDDICQLVHDFHNEMYTLMFIKTFFETEAREWFGLDQWRMNKFMMLIREFLHNSFLFVKNGQWKEGVCQELSNILEKSVLNSNNSDLPIGLQLHLIDIFPTELQKVADEKLSSDTAVILLSPFLNMLPTIKNGNVMKKVLSLLFEASGGKECPKDENSKEPSYRPCGFTERDPTKIKETKLQFNKELLLKQLVEKGSNKTCSAKNRSLIYNLVKRIRSLETNPQKPIKIIKEKDINEKDVEVPEKEILAAAKKLKKEKEKLMEKVPTRKEYKRQLVMEKKKSKKLSTNIDINEADTEEEMEEDDDNDADSLEYDPEAEFLRLSTESDNDSHEEEMDADVEELSDDKCLPDEPVEKELAKVKDQENSAATKKNKKSRKAGSKRKNEEPLEENVILQVPEKMAKNEKNKKKKLDNVSTVVAAPEKMEVELHKGGKKSRKRKRKTKEKSEGSSISSGVSKTELVFGMVDFPEEEENTVNESINLSEVGIDVQKSSEENGQLKKKSKKKAKKVKHTKKSKKFQVTEELQGTDGQSEKPAKLLHFPLPTNAKDSVDISNIQMQNTLNLFEHLKKLKAKEDTNLEKSKTKVTTSQLDQYFDQIKKEVDSIEKKKKSNVVEEKNSSMSKEKVTVPVKEAPSIVEKTKTKIEKKSKKMVKSKTASIIKDKPAAPVKIKPEKAEPELDISERLEKLHKQPPAFLRNAISKVEKLKKGDKSKKPKAEKSALIKKSSTPQGAKHVSFDMDQNEAFEEGSPINQNAFHPGKKPENGILKPSISPIRISKKFSMDKKLSMLAKQSYVAHFF